MRNERVAALEHPAVVQERGRDTVDVCGDPGHVQGAQQGFAGHARVVRTFTAQQVTLHDHGGEVAAFDRVLGRVLAHRSATDDHDVHGEFVLLRLMVTRHEYPS